MYVRSTLSINSASGAVGVVTPVGVTAVEASADTSETPTVLSAVSKSSFVCTVWSVGSYSASPRSY